MYYEAATTKGIIIHTNAAAAAAAGWIQYLAWNDDCRKQTRHSACSEFVCWGETRG